MRKLSIFAIALAMAGGLDSAVAQTEPAPVGIVGDPCATLPKMPPISPDLAAYIQKFMEAKATVPPVSKSVTDALAKLEAWQQQMLVADFFGYCRYTDANAALSPPTDHRVVFFGDSLTELWGPQDAQIFAGDVVNRGISGQTTAQMLGRFRADVLALKPRVLHLLAGSNDIAGNTGATTLTHIQSNIESMVELALAHDIKVIIGSVLPATRYPWRPQIQPVPHIHAMNAWLRDYAARKKLIYVDYFTVLKNADDGLRAEYSKDGVHPDATGYQVMHPLAKQAIARALDGH